MARHGNNKNSTGFTLVEIIAVLLILAIIGVFGSMLVVSMVKSYQWADDNAHLAQKTQVALTRIAAELTYAQFIEVEDDTTILYIAVYPGESIGDTTQSSGMISLSNGEIMLDEQYTLIDRVTRFAVREDEENDRLVHFEIQVTGANDEPQLFETSIARP